jgi:hypothetical protein
MSTGFTTPPFDDKRAERQTAMAKRLYPIIEECGCSDAEVSEMLYGMSIHYGLKAVGGSGTVCVNPMTAHADRKEGP